MDNNITLLVQNFCRQLIHFVPEFQELSQAKHALEADSSSKQLWKDKEEQRETIELMKKKDLPVSSQQNEILAKKLKEMRENPITMRYLKAINLASKISGRIGTQLKETIGADFAARKGCK